MPSLQLALRTTANLTFPVQTKEPSPVGGFGVAPKAELGITRVAVYDRGGLRVEGRRGKVQEIDN